MSTQIPPDPTPNKEPEKKKVVIDVEPEIQNDRYENFFSQATSNTRDIIAYVLLVLGIVLLFAQHIYGEFIIGLVAGVYFSKEIADLIKNFESFVDKQGLARSIILGGTLLALFIIAPALFVGIAVVVLLRLFIFNEKV